MSTDTETQTDLRHVGDRIEQLLDELAATGLPDITGRAHEVVRLVAELYGGGLARIVEMLDEAGESGRTVLERISRDELVASLLVVHGLHPLTLDQRIERALEDVRPYLGSHGGDVEYLGVDDAGTVKLRLLGSCDGCPSSSVTLELAVQGAIEGAAPETTGIDVEGLTDSDAGPEVPNLISPDSLSRRPAEAGASQPPGPMADGAEGGLPTWAELPDINELGIPEARGVAIEDVDVIVCRVEAGVYAYVDRCAACSSGLLGGTLEGSTLTCGQCGARFDVEQAGRGTEDPSLHLHPLPVLARDGVHEIAVPAAVAG